MKAVIFDLDGTLLNTIDTITYYCNKAMQKFGFDLSSPQEYKYFVGNGAVKLIERAMGKTGNFTKEDFDKVYSYYNEIYNAEPLYLTRPYDKIPKLLSDLKKDGVKIGILSNKPDEAVQGVAKHFLSGLYDLVSGSKEGVALKPDPEAAKMMLSTLGAHPSESFFAGDSSVDILTGRAAGLHTIGVNWGFRTNKELRDAGAEYTVDSPDEIYSIIKAF